MKIDLAGTKDGISERFAPERDAGRLIEAEHVARYRWAAQLAGGRTVLDAGCGTGYGCELLAQGGAREVVGVDIAAAVLDAVRPAMPSTVRLETGDLTDLGYGDDTFDLVVCFEVIEHFRDPFVVLDQLLRVMAPDGLLLISSPNRGYYPSGNPHHYHEFRPDELHAELSSRLGNVELVRQRAYVVSALLGDDDYSRGNGVRLDDLKVHKLTAGEPGEETYTVALASNAGLPRPRQLAAMTGALELREWMSAADFQTNAIREKDNYIAELEARMQERDRLNELLVDAEQRLADIPTLQLRITDLEFELAEARKAAGAARAEARTLDERLTRAQRVLTDVLNSPSWRVTKPMRAAKKLLRS